MQKALPMPVMMPTHRSSSLSSSSQTSCICRLVVLSMQFSLVVRVSVTCMIRWSGNETSKCSYFRGSWCADIASAGVDGINSHRRTSIMFLRYFLLRHACNLALVMKMRGPCSNDGITPVSLTKAFLPRTPWSFIWCCCTSRAAVCWDQNGSFPPPGHGCCDIAVYIKCESGK